MKTKSFLLATIFGFSLTVTTTAAQQMGSFTDPRDKKTYKTVKIGTQTWMAENLNYAADGSICYEDEPKNCAKYGRQYNWEAAMKACPSGWHLPSEAECGKLIATGGGYKVLGSGNWWGSSDNKNINYAYTLNIFKDVGYYYADDDDYHRIKSSLLSVRCLQDNAESKAEIEAKIKAEIEAKAKLETVRKANGGSTFIDTRDNKIYWTIKIGKQTWMAENLNYNASGSKCYDNKISNCDKYGRLYDWETAKKSCPQDWHLPSDKEWTLLTDFVGGSETAGTKLKAKNGWNESGDDHIQDKSGNGEDKFGFSALPGGHGYSDGTFHTFRLDEFGSEGIWWTSTDINNDNVWTRSIYNRNRDVYRDVYRNSELDKAYLFSVRCVKD